MASSYLHGEVIQHQCQGGGCEAREGTYVGYIPRRWARIKVNGDVFLLCPTCQRDYKEMATRKNYRVVGQ